MSTAPKKPDGTKPAIKPAGGMLNDRRIRLRPDGVTVDNAPYDGGGIGKKRPKPYSQDR